MCRCTAHDERVERRASCSLPDQVAGCPLAGQRADLEDWHIACSGCTGSAPHTRGRRHLLSGAPELGPCTRLETPNARAGQCSDRIRRTSDSGKGPFSDVPLASAMRAVSSEDLKPSALLLLPFRGTLFLQRFLWFLLRLSPSVQTLAHGSLPWNRARLSRSATRGSHLAPFRASTQSSIDHSPL